MILTLIAAGAGAALLKGIEKRAKVSTEKQNAQIRDREAYDRWYCERVERPLLPYARPLRLLSFDGGGVRGLMSLVMLKELMNTVGYGTRPCEYFDLIGGTSTGGLIAIMLGRLRMSVDDCIKAYRELAKGIFDVNLIERAGRVALHTAQFDGGRLQHAIERIVAQQWRGEAMYEQADGLCRTFVVAARGIQANQPPKLFRSYHNYRRSSLADNCYIWEAGRATSCAPVFFPEVKVQGIVYADGGLGHNNPSRLVLDEAKSLWGDQAPIGCLVSFGTGQMRENIMRTRTALDLLGLVPVLKNIALNCEQTHISIEEHFKSTPGTYHRFNAVLEQEIDLNEWEKMQEMEMIAVRYMQREWLQFTRCAEVIREGSQYYTGGFRQARYSAVF